MSFTSEEIIQDYENLDIESIILSKQIFCQLEVSTKTHVMSHISNYLSFMHS